MKATLGATLCLLSPAAPEPCQSGDGAKAGRFTTAGSDREEADAEEEVAEEEVEARRWRPKGGEKARA